MSENNHYFLRSKNAHDSENGEQLGEFIPYASKARDKF